MTLLSSKVVRTFFVLMFVQSILVCSNPSRIHSREVRINDIFSIVSGQTVEVASKRKEKIEEAPGIIAIVTAEEIRRFGAVNLLDVLDRLTSIYHLGSHLFRDNVASIRGDLSTHNDVHTLVLINGRPFRSSQSARHLHIYTAFPLDSIERIELIRGPGSVLYGTTAFQGVINVITKVGTETPEIKASAGIGSFGSNTFSGSISGMKNDFNIQVGYRYYKDEGWPFEGFDESIVRGGTTIHPARKQSANYGQKDVSVNFLTSYKNLKFTGFYVHKDVTILGVIPIWPEGGQEFDRLMWDVGYVQPITENWDASINMTNNVDSQVFENDNPVGPSTTFIKHASNDYLTELTIRGSIIEDLNVVFGGISNYQTGPGNPSSPLGPSPVGPYFDNWWSGYLQVDYKPISKLKLIAGAQINAPQNIQSNAVPRVGAIYNFNQHWGTKVLYGEAFRSAFKVESGINIPNVLKGNPNLTPEKIKTTDLNVFYNTDKTQSGLTLFYTKQKDLFVRVPAGAAAAGALTFTNRAELTTRGLELETKMSPWRNLFVMGSYSYQENEDATGKENTTFMPNNMVKAGVSYDWSCGVSASIFNSYYSKRFDVSIVNPASVNHNPAADPFSWMTANVTFDISKLFSLGRPREILLGFYGVNLLNENVYDPEIDVKLVNTLPARPRAAFYVTLGMKL